MSLFSKLFGGGEKSEPEPVSYRGFEIFPDLMPEGGKYRLLARIEKTIDGDRKTHTVIRRMFLKPGFRAKASASQRRNR